MAPGDRLARWLRRADVLGRFAWVGDPQARAIGWRTALRVAIQSPLLHPAVLWYVGFWLFFLLPWQPWTWADDPILLAISLLALAILAWSWLRRPRPAQLADG